MSKKNYYFSKKDFSRIPTPLFKKIAWIAGIIFLCLFIFICIQVYIPANPVSQETVTYTVQQGWSISQIATDLQKLSIIRSSYFFKVYVILSLQYSNLKAGEYLLSPRMSAYEIAKKMSEGDVIKNNAVIMAGWDLQDIGTYLESKNICTQTDFTALTKEDFSGQFDFLQDKPQSATLEGYLFPDTYALSKTETCRQIIVAMLSNFGKKLTPKMRADIAAQHTSIFNIVTMASILEKEVRTLNDKKMVAGVLYNRMQIGMALQVDSTVNYITGKNAQSASVHDKEINSPYNTYKYPGLPKGPISNPGLDSLMAAIYPTKNDDLYYLTGFDDETIFSQTLQQQDAAIQKYIQ